MRLLTFDTPAQMLAQADRWDNLWLRSEVTCPTARAQLVAAWFEQFAPGQKFRALAVEEGDRLVAALPLLGPSCSLLPIGKLPGNCWSDGGTLLLDLQASAEAALDMLLQGMRRLPWPVILVDGIASDSISWQQFFHALQNRRAAYFLRPKFEVGLIDIGGQWQRYEAALSGNIRRASRKSRRKLEERGPLELTRYSNITPTEAEYLLRTVCEVEDRSWKGEEGTSILKSPGMFEFFARQARQLAEWGQIEMLVLRQQAEVLAAEFGYAAKGVYYSHKIAYDPQYSEYGPGRLLRYLTLENYFTHRTFQVLDTLGVLDAAKAKWCTRKYRLDRGLLSTGSCTGNALVAAYEHIWPRLRKGLGRPRPAVESPKLGAATFLEELNASGALELPPGTLVEPAARS